MQWFFENSFLFLECIMEKLFFFLVRFGFAEGVEMEMEMREETKGKDELDFVSFFFI